jgi:hypothetical protein
MGPWAHSRALTCTHVSLVLELLRTRVHLYCAAARRVEVCKNLTLDTQVTRISKLSRNGNFRAWAVQLQAVSTTSDEHDRFLRRRPTEGDVDESPQELQARANLNICLGPEM